MLNSLNSDGSYLIRESESTPGGYSLSVRYRDQISHYKIYQNKNRECFIAARSTFKSLQDLVDHYQQHAQPDELCVNLKKPCVIPGMDVSGYAIDEWQTDRTNVIHIRKQMSNELTEVWDSRVCGIILHLLQSRESNHDE